MWTRIRRFFRGVAICAAPDLILLLVLFAIFGSDIIKFNEDLRSISSSLSEISKELDDLNACLRRMYNL